MGKSSEERKENVDEWIFEDSEQEKTEEARKIEPAKEEKPEVKSTEVEEDKPKEEVKLPVEAEETKPELKLPERKEPVPSSGLKSKIINKKFLLIIGLAISIFFIIVYFVSYLSTNGMFVSTTSSSVQILDTICINNNINVAMKNSDTNDIFVSSIHFYVDDISIIPSDCSDDSLKQNKVVYCKLNNIEKGTHTVKITGPFGTNTESAYCG